MKKALILSCILCLLCSSALANTITNESMSQTTTTTVSYTIEACKEYTVTIPSTVSLDNTKTMAVSLDATEYQLDYGKESVRFVISFDKSENFEPSSSGGITRLTHKDDKNQTIQYDITNENGTTIYVGKDLLDVEYWREENWPTTAHNAIFTLTAKPTGNEIPGTYTDTLTFSVEHYED